MTWKIDTRWRAAALHLCLSALVAASVFSFIFFLWYPGALFKEAGGRELFALIAGVDVCLGPLITLIIFKRGKKGLKFDLATIAFLQLCALSYGVSVLYESRPVWIVFVKDRFELVRANNIFDKDLAEGKAPFDSRPITGPRLAAARLPTDPDEQLRLGLSALRGHDVQDYPKYLVSYQSQQAAAAAKAMPISRLRELNPTKRDTVDKWLKRLGRGEQGVGFLPMRAGRVDLTVFLDRRTGAFLGTADLRPWKYD